MDYLFDIGRVLLDFDFESSLVELAPRNNSSAAAQLQLLMQRKDELEAGFIEPDGYIDWALETLGSEADPLQFTHAWRNIFTPNQAMWSHVRELHDTGHRLILFSNTNAIHCPWIFDAYPEFSLFHGSVLSFEVGAIKPNPEIYQHAIDTYDLDPANTRYIDDLPENIATGMKFGFDCHQYDLHQHADFVAWLNGCQPE